MAYQSQLSVSGNRPYMSAALVTSQPLVFVIELGIKLPYYPISACDTHDGITSFLGPIRVAMQSTGIPECTIKRKGQNDFRTWCITENQDDKCEISLSSNTLFVVLELRRPSLTRPVVLNRSVRYCFSKAPIRRSQFLGSLIASTLHRHQVFGLRSIEPLGHKDTCCNSPNDVH